MATKVEALTSIHVLGAGEGSTNGKYVPRSPALVPAGFTRTCDAMGWPSTVMWQRLSDSTSTWYEAPNEAYIYWNRSDGHWWIDLPSGAGAYIAQSSSTLPPFTGWKALPGNKSPLPTIELDSAVGEEL